MDTKKILKGIVITSSMMSLSLLPVIVPAYAVDNIPVKQTNSYMTKEQFTEYNLWTNYINDYPNDAFGYLNRANVQYSAKDYKNAIADYDKAIELDVYNADAYMKRGNCYFILKDNSKAMLDYLSASQVSPKMGEAFFNMGRVYYEQNDLDNAISNMQKGVAYVNNRSDYYYELGRAEYRSGKYQDAYNNFSNAIALNPADSDSHFGKGLAALNLNSNEAAVQDFQNVLNIDPQYKNAEYYKGLALYQSGRFQDAITSFDNAILQSPEDGLIYNLRGCSKELLGDTSGAKKDYKKAKSLGIEKVGLNDEVKAAYSAKPQKTAEVRITEKTEPPKVVNVPENSSFVWVDKPITPKERVILDEMARDRLIKEALASGDIYGTIALLERIAEENPQNPEHYIKLAETKVDINSYAGVISDVETAVANGSNNPQAYYLEGLAYRNSGNNIYAYRNFALCYNADSSNPDYIYNLATAAYSIGRYKETYELADKLLDSNLEDRYPEARLLKAKSEYRLGKYYSSVDNCNKYLKNNEKSAEAYICRAFSKEALEHYDEAIKDYSKAIKYDKRNVNLYKLRGDLHLAQGHISKAIHDYDKIVSIKGNNATSYDYLRVAQLEEKRGNYDNAIICYSKILQKDDLNDGAYLSRAKAYSQKGDVYNAIADYNSTIRLNPYQTSVYKERGILLVKVKSYRRGADDLDKAILMEPENGQLYFYRAIANKALGRQKEATADYEKAKKFERL